MPATWLSAPYRAGGKSTNGVKALGLGSGTGSSRNGLETIGPVQGGPDGMRAEMVVRGVIPVSEMRELLVSVCACCSRGKGEDNDDEFCALMTGGWTGVLCEAYEGDVTPLGDCPCGSTPGTCTETEPTCFGNVVGSVTPRPNRASEGSFSFQVLDDHRLPPKTGLTFVVIAVAAPSISAVDS